MVVRLALTVTILTLALGLGGMAKAVEKTPVLLTIDVETQADADALTALEIRVPVTFFVLGEFIERYPDLVRRWSDRNTIGAHSYRHPNLTKLSKEELLAELERDLKAHQEVLGQRPQWFRAPYLASNATIEKALYDLGYIGSSSQPERWSSVEHIMELPISNDDMLASDYDLFRQSKMPDAAVLAWLKARFLERRKTGRPFVILLHPDVAVPHRTVFSAFIDYVQRNDGEFLTFDDYRKKIMSKSADRQAAWIVLEHGPIDPEEAAKRLKDAGFTDTFLMARSTAGENFFNTSGEEGPDRFGSILEALKSAGLRVHAWLPVLRNRRLVENRPDWAMTEWVGRRSDEWWSPANPAARARFVDTVKGLLSRYDLDGIHLDYIRYPDLNADLNPATLVPFVEQYDISPDINAEDVLRDHFVAWTNWRAGTISGLVAEVRAAIGPDIVLSAALMGQAATEFRASEVYGQDYGQLAPFLDIVVPMAYANLNGKEPRWIDLVRHQAQFRVGRTHVWVGIEGYQEPGRPHLGRSDFTAALARARIGADGFSIYAYPFLFALGSSSWNLPTGSGAVLRE